VAVRIPRIKTSVPELPSQFISRRRLLDVLEAGEGEVTLVCAPPGYGKTLLLADWTRRTADDTTAWVSLDRDDNDPERLCAGIAAALGRCAAVPTDSAVHQLGVPPRARRYEFWSDLVDALHELPVLVRLILDDLQEVVDRDALGVMQQLVRHLPPTVRLTLSSRLDPPLSLVRLRLEGRLGELRAEHLRFTSAETAELLAIAAPSLEPAQIAVLQEGTDGWPAGVRLASSSLSAAEDPERFLAEFSGDERSVADYLVGEVLQSMAADTRELLSLVSVCDPIPSELAIELSGRSDAPQVLNVLEHDSGLITRGPRRSEYRVHVLLRTYLRAELARQRPALILQLNALAANWWASRGRPVEALSQAIDGVSGEVLTDLLVRSAVPLLLTGDHALLNRALTAAGDAAARQPLLAAVSSAVRAASTTDEITVVGSRDPAAASAGIADDVPVNRERSRQAWALPAAGELTALRMVTAAFPDDGADDRVPRAAVSALTAFRRGAELLSERGDARAALKLLSSALDRARAHTFDYLEMQCQALSAAAAAGLDECAAMTAAGEGALTIAGEHGWQRTTWSTAAQVVLAYSALLRAEPAEAYRLAGQGQGGAGAVDRELEFGLRFVLGAAAFDRGQHAAGLQQMHHARANLGDRHLAAVQAAAAAVLEYRAALAAGHRTAARSILSWSTGRTGQCGETQLMRSWDEAHAGRAAAARAALRPLLDGSMPPLLPHSVVEAHLVQAQLDLFAGDRASARRALRRALTVAAPLGVLRPFVLAGPALHELLVHQVGSFGDAEPIAEAALGVLQRRRDASGDTVLSARETGVLSLLPTLLSLDEIAEELGISINTVKSHTRTIYAKLGVSTRRGAVVSAHERGLLSIRHLPDDQSAPPSASST
jgi:LuxR family transcriptional regulator, maltose regulon positive regulatory protein